MTDLWQRLFVAYHTGDEHTFIELCRTHAQTVVREFNGWAVVPAEIRADPQSINAYGSVLIATAQVLEALGHPEPMNRLNPQGAANPINAWNYAYQRAQHLHDAGEHAASTDELRSLLADVEGSSGPGVDELRAKISGLLGANAQRLGNVDEALEHTRDALRRCRELNDLEGVWIYTENAETLFVAKEITDGTETGRELAHTRDRLAFAQDLSDTRRYPASNDVLRELLTAVTGTAGTRYLGKIHGLLGLNHFNLGELDAASENTRLALAECRARQDYAGERIYAANLAEIERSAQRGE
ncbi:hypothetical protein [Lentzea aerocolonigenes]|uniref:hypothetical protein n=1 Tax=Lentzea aerocolonigenes TaxID=68170 RepID=UPI0004C47315|nr:hypothetical protein [Lentzea aerocolonigenes]MCP2250130.1 hypothetical protein [Lentzea aerocolonigenes]